MSAKSRFFDRYPLLIEGMLFMLGQLFVGFLIVSSRRQHLEVCWLVLICAAILFVSFSLRNTWSRSSIHILALILGIISQVNVLSNATYTQEIGTNKIIRGQFKVIDNPRRKSSQKVTFTVVALDYTLRPTRLRVSAVELPWRNVSGIRNSDYFKATLYCRPINKIDSIFSYHYLMLRRGISAACKVIFLKPLWNKQRSKTFIEQLRNSLPETNFYRLEYGLLLSLIFGVDAEIPTQLEKSFKRAGLTHLLVFSGAQTSIIYYSLAYILRFIMGLINRWFYFGYSGYLEVIVAFLGTVAFCGLIGFESSTMRAVIASGLIVFSALKETNQGMLYRMFLSLIILCSIWPGCFLEPGVQLTYAALFGIWFGLQFKNKFVSYINMSLSVSLLTNTITWLWFGSVSIAGIILNPIIAPAVSVFSVYCGIPAVMLIYTGSENAQILGSLVLWCLSHLERFVFWVSRFTWAYYNPGNDS